jgi:hypothetical protein
MAIVCKAIEQIRLPEGGVSVGQISQVGGTGAGKAARAVTGDVLGQIAQAMASAADGLLKTLSSFWMNVDTPQLGGGTSPVAAIQASTGWITTCTAVVCILAAAGRMAIRRRGQPAAVMAMGLTRLVVVSAAATFVIEAAGKLADSFSANLMSAAHLGNGGWSGIISTATLAGAFASGDGMLLIIALLIIFSSLIQLMLMILRTGLLVILTGTLPLAAAASMSEWGESWWRRHMGWLAAWLLYKPAAALLYFGAFTLTGGKNTGVEVISGFMLLILAILILPALLKVIVPMTASLGAASSGTLALGAAGAVATGAIKIAALRGTGGTGAAAAPSGSGSGSGETAITGPGGAGAGAEADPPPGGKSSSAERHMAQPSATGFSAQDSAATGGTCPQAGGTVSGAGPADDASQDQRTRPAGSATNRPGGTDSSRPKGPAGAGSSGAGPASVTGMRPAGGDASSPAGAATSGTDGYAAAGDVSTGDSAGASGSSGGGTGPGARPADGPSPGGDAASAGGPSGAADSEDDEQREIGG